MFYGLMFSAIFESFEWTAACGAVGEFSIRQLPKNHTLGTQGFEKHVEGLKGAAAEFCSLFNPFLSWLSSRIPSIGQKVCLSNLAKANRHSHLVFCSRHDLQTTNLKISKSFWGICLQQGTTTAGLLFFLIPFWLAGQFEIFIFLIWNYFVDQNNWQY